VSRALLADIDRLKRKSGPSCRDSKTREGRQPEAIQNPDEPTKAKHSSPAIRASKGLLFRKPIAITVSAAVAAIALTMAIPLKARRLARRFL
jgi:hypothetical protein